MTPGAASGCPYCHGRRWVEDENWAPDDPATWDGTRTHYNGLIPCGGCNEGGWTTPDWQPAPPDAPSLRAALERIENLAFTRKYTSYKGWNSALGEVEDIARAALAAAPEQPPTLSLDTVKAALRKAGPQSLHWKGSGSYAATVHAELLALLPPATGGLDVERLEALRYAVKQHLADPDRFTHVELQRAYAAAAPDAEVGE